MKWIKPAVRPFQTSLAMIGAKPGQQVLIVGAGDGRLAAAVALVTGLNGRTVAVDPSPDARPKVETAAADEGALVDFEQAPLENLPSTPGGFDVVVIHQSLTGSATPATTVVAEAARVVRKGGRVVAIEGGSTSALFGIVRRPIPAMGAEAVRDLFSAAGLRAARVLAQSEGVSYIEAARSQHPL